MQTPSRYTFRLSVPLMAVAITLSLTTLMTAQKQTDLVSSWSGSTARVFSGDNDGYLVNGAKIGAGKINKGFLFDGIDDYVLVPPDPRLNVGAQGSIALWMRADPTNLMDTCCQGLVTTDFFGVSIASAPAGVVFFVRTTDGEWVHTSDTDGCSQCAGGWPVGSGEWHHIVGTYDGTQLQLYVDGVAVGNPRFHTGTVMPMLAGAFLSIGSEDGRRDAFHEPRYFHGNIDEVAIYKRALTPVEVSDLFLRVK
jgi:Concanavalin A-like lectin/glucanases superfamily